MKLTRIIVSVILIATIALAWMLQLGRAAGNANTFHKSVEEADRYNERGLYQLAIRSYDQALKIKDNSDVRNKWLESHRLAYEEETIPVGEYIEALSKTCDIYPKDPSHWETLIDLYIERNDYSSAARSLKKARQNGAKSEKLIQMDKEINYTFQMLGGSYTSFNRAPNGSYSVCGSLEKWGIINDKGESVLEAEYEYIGPLNNDGFMLVRNSKGSRLNDSNNITYGFLPEKYEVVRAANNNIIPYKDTSGWHYYNCDTDEVILETYEDASSFTDGAAVVKSDSKWKLIDTEGNMLSDKVFDDVKLLSNGDRCFSGVMVAAVDGVYSLYDGKGEKICDFSCKDADAYYGEETAFKDESGKWGFVNKKGEVVIEPTYEEAKSFSKGLAAVKRGDKWGYINTDGEEVIECQFLYADYFSSGGITIVSKEKDHYNIIKLLFP